MKDLLLHTASRSVASVSTAPTSRGKIQSTLIYKYGFDGSSGHSQHKQVWQTEDRTDEFLIMSSLLSLRLLNDASGKGSATSFFSLVRVKLIQPDVLCVGEIIWENPRPSSKRLFVEL
ncbi:hypothetical protein J437_LFUL016304 [Ladona fulva]|uniref:Uncharacterized protein n=1 Tax=Ladona fulva TaxID=123851 RepID=A0A8K0P4N4_LADFU|nr:hypothetical protein J437_LFUL016304 [Ladona fulva]